MTRSSPLIRKQLEAFEKSVRPWVAWRPVSTPTAVTWMSTLLAHAGRLEWNPTHDSQSITLLLQLIRVWDGWNTLPDSWDKKIKVRLEKWNIFPQEISLALMELHRTQIQHYWALIWGKGENVARQNNWKISVKYIKVKQFLHSWIIYLHQGSYLTGSVHHSVRKITHKSSECILIENFQETLIMAGPWPLNFQSCASLLCIAYTLYYSVLGWEAHLLPLQGYVQSFGGC